MIYGDHRTFEVVGRVNKERALEWHRTGLGEWSPAEWGNALAGECGELCNVLKKILRHDKGIQQRGVISDLGELADDEMRAMLVAMAAEEIGDVYTYLDLLCQVLDLDMYDCIRDKFNAISERENLPQRLGL